MIQPCPASICDTAKKAKFHCELRRRCVVVRLASIAEAASPFSNQTSSIHGSESAGPTPVHHSCQHLEEVALPSIANVVGGLRGGMQAVQSI
eukprot:1161306-Pelagomonas_calceolata.AAC.2